jgi:putative FmdB family regulatory protein
MPIYEYQRPDGSTFEVLQSFSDEPLTRDPQSGVPVRRVLHAPAVHFKGSGFYNTDYGTRKRQREQSEKADGAATGADAPSAEKSAAGTAGEGAGKAQAKPKAQAQPKAEKAAVVA